MRILALDLGKYKTVACEYEAESGRHRFVTVATTPKALHDLMVEREPQRVVIEICSIAGWVGDLVRSLGIELQVGNTSDERWQWRKVKQKNDRHARFHANFAAPIMLRNTPPPLRSTELLGGVRSHEHTCQSGHSPQPSFNFSTEGLLVFQASSSARLRNNILPDRSEWPARFRS